MIAQGIAMVLMNTPESMGSAHGDYMLLTRDGELSLKGTKREIANAIWNSLLNVRSDFSY